MTQDTATQGGTTGRLIVGPFNRVEGDLEVRLNVQDGRVQEAHVVSPMYRGFENLLLGRDPMDALVVVPRICGICSVSQSVAAAQALADAAGVKPPPNGQHVHNLMLATENVADHLTHFYLFFMPDFTRAVYAPYAWHPLACARYAPQGGERTRAALAARQRWFELMGVLGGRWPHTHSIQPGGSSRPIEPAERMHLRARVRELRSFLERELLGGALEDFLSLTGENALRNWTERSTPGLTQGPADLPFFLMLAEATGLHHLGRGPGRWLSHGSFPQPDGQTQVPRGTWHDGHLLPLDVLGIAEDTTHAWLNHDDPLPRHPRQGLTQPSADKPDAYTWNKAPRLNGEVAECGAIARQLALGHPLVRAAVLRCGSTVYTRVLARLVDMVQMVVWMEDWLQALQAREPWHQPVLLPRDGEGVGLSEAARGALGHWLRIERGLIASYQIIAPTSWNFSPRDAQGQPGPLESALVGAPVRPGETTPVAVQHIVRSFDPCMVCTVH